MSARRFDVVVVGGGAIGLAVAWRAVSAGMSVGVVDGRPGTGASWAAAGMLAPVTELHFGEEALLRLNLLSAERYPAFVDELQQESGVDVGYRRCGTLSIARDADENAHLAQVHRFQVGLGLDAVRLRAHECRELEPSLTPSVRGGILVASDHQVDNRALLDALVAACRRRRVAFIAEDVVEVAVKNGIATGVVTEGARVDCGAIVVAAGCRSSGIRGIPEGAIPVRPVKGQLLQLRGAGARLFEHNIRGLDAYLVARADGRVVVGATMEEKGFDTSVTAGGVFELLRAASELVPGIAELDLTETVAGLRPGSPDNAPIVGPTEVEGLIAAAGHFRNGILLTPVTADAVATYLASGSMAEEMAEFGPARFDRHAAVTT
jgi:glycine oxidase